MNNRYRRPPFVEPFRKLLRALDLLTLLAILRARRTLPAWSMLRKMTLIELGPGPMRLAALKRALFRRVYFLDQSDFGIPDPGLRLLDVSVCHDARVLRDQLCSVPQGEPVLLFADHFLEHLPETAATGLLESIQDCGRDGDMAACFRVPNVLSPQGRSNYGRDRTHQTSFEPGLRGRIGGMGFRTFSWVRCYRGRLLVRALARPASAMRVAEEIVICSGAAGSGAWPQRSA